MSRLKIRLDIAVSEEADKKDPDLEIELRMAVVKAREIIELVGRGKFEVNTTYEREAPKTRRPSKRKPKSKGVSNER